MYLQDGLMQIYVYFIVRHCPRAETDSQASKLSLYNKKKRNASNQF